MLSSSSRQQRTSASPVAVPGRRRRTVGSDVVLDPLQQSRLAHSLVRRPLVAVRLRTTEDELHLAGVAAPRREQRVARFRCRPVLPAGQVSRLGTDVRLEALPQRGRRVEKEEVDITTAGDSVEDVEVARRQARQAEQRHPVWQVQEVGLRAEPRRRRSRGAPPGAAGQCARAGAARARIATLPPRAAGRPGPSAAPCRVGARHSDRRGPRRAARWRSAQAPSTDQAAQAAPVCPARPRPWRLLRYGCGQPTVPARARRSAVRRLP